MTTDESTEPEARDLPDADSSREGAVMLVVMLILLVATASAAVAVHTTQSELHAAGQERLALQTRYVSEVAIMTTTSWIDQLGDDFQGIWDRWATKPAPDLTRYGEAPFTADTRHNAIRTGEYEQTGLPQYIQPPLWLGGGAAGSGGGGGGGSGGASAPADPSGIGTFGPRQAYGLPSDPTSGQFLGYTVDVTDCVQAPPAYTPGMQIGSNAGLVPTQFYCTLTARGRVVLPGAPAQRGWTFGGSIYNQDPFMCAQDSRATILTPIMWVQNPNH
jgi:hypothetical protein